MDKVGELEVGRVQRRRAMMAVAVNMKAVLAMRARTSVILISMMGPQTSQRRLSSHASIQERCAVE